MYSIVMNTKEKNETAKGNGKLKCSDSLLKGGFIFLSFLNCMIWRQSYQCQEEHFGQRDKQGLGSKPNHYDRTLCYPKASIT